MSKENKGKTTTVRMSCKRKKPMNREDVEQTKKLHPLPNTISVSTETESHEVCFDICNLYSKSPLISAFLEVMKIDEVDDIKKPYNLDRIPKEL